MINKTPTFYGFDERTIQIHPTLECNLYCKHCYSESGPQLKTSLNKKIICDVIKDAANLGYSVVSISGGEPLLYDGIEDILEYAKTCGMYTSLTTNGTILDNTHIKKINEHLDLLAISLDGPPELHNTIRNHTNAFKILKKGLRNIRENNVHFGFIHTLTKQSWEHLPWIAEFAYEHKASLLQIHPLEITGRSIENMESYYPDDTVLANTYLLSLSLIAKYNGIMKIQLDIFPKDYLLKNTNVIYASAVTSQDVEELLNKKNVNASNLLNSLIVEADGSVVPIVYGLAKKYAICNLNSHRLSDSWDKYVKGGGYFDFRELCRVVFENKIKNHDFPLLNWYELMVINSNILKIDKNHSTNLC